MKERPILFSGKMVRSLLAGTKTQTRRIVKDTGFYAINASVHGAVTAARELKALATQCPHGMPGDRLWVKETWAHNYRAPLGASDRRPYVLYRANGDDAEKWTPSIFMRRRSSRITLEITAVRVERLNDISADDAMAEGIDTLSGIPTVNAISDYRALWESINGAGSWAANPWVWVISFRRIEP